MENQEVKNLAEKLAVMLQSEGESNENFLRASLEKINERLNTIESQIAHPNRQSTIENRKSVHPSQGKFLNLESIAEEIINGLPDEKACPYEPTGKPCDNCSMCNSLGY